MSHIIATKSYALASLHQPSTAPSPSLPLRFPWLQFKCRTTVAVPVVQCSSAARRFGSRLPISNASLISLSGRSAPLNPLAVLRRSGMVRASSEPSRESDTTKERKAVNLFVVVEGDKDGGETQGKGGENGARDDDCGPDGSCNAFIVASALSPQEDKRARDEARAPTEQRIKGDGRKGDDHQIQNLDFEMGRPKSKTLLNEQVDGNEGEGLEVKGGPRSPESHHRHPNRHPNGYSEYQVSSSNQTKTGNERESTNPNLDALSKSNRSGKHGDEEMGRTSNLVKNGGNSNRIPFAYKNGLKSERSSKANQHPLLQQKFEEDANFSDLSYRRDGNAYDKASHDDAEWKQGHEKSTGYEERRGEKAKNKRDSNHDRAGNDSTAASNTNITHSGRTENLELTNKWMVSRLGLQKRGEGPSSNHEQPATDRMLLLKNERQPFSKVQHFITRFFAFCHALYKFSRPHTIYGTFISVLSVSLLTLSPSLLSRLFLFPSSSSLPSSLAFSHPLSLGASLQSVAVALVSSLLVNVSIVGLNQLYDIEIDRVNKPYLPLVTGELTVRQGWLIVLSCLALSLTVSWLGRSTGFPSYTLAAMSKTAAFDMTNNAKTMLTNHAKSTTMSKLLNAASATSTLAASDGASQHWLWLTMLCSFLLGAGYSISAPGLRWKQSPFLAALCISLVRSVGVQWGISLHLRSKRLVGEMGSVSLGRSINPPIKDHSKGYLPYLLTHLASGSNVLNGVGRNVAVLSLFAAAFAVAIALLKDLPDVEGDEASGVFTLASRLGRRTVFNGSVALIILAYLGAGAGFAADVWETAGLANGRMAGSVNLERFRTLIWAKIAFLITIHVIPAIMLARKAYEVHKDCHWMEGQKKREVGEKGEEVLGENRTVKESRVKTGIQQTIKREKLLREEKDVLTKFYMFIWKLFYAEYVMITIPYVLL